MAVNAHQTNPRAAVASAERTRFPAGAVRRGTGRGFTIIELLVVISIILIAAVAILPAFGRLIESNNYASAVNAVTATLGAARTQAVRSGRRTGVVFLFDIKTEKTTLLIVEQHGSSSGSLSNQVAATNVNSITGAYAEVFVPAEGLAAVELPKGMGVFGLSSAMESGTAQTTQPLVTLPEPMWRWYAGDVLNSGNATVDDDVYLWLFPRNDPRLFTTKENASNVGVDPWLTLRGITTSPAIGLNEAVAAVRNVTTFFIVFDSDGSVATSRRTGSAVYFDAYLELKDAPVDPTAPLTPPIDDEYSFDPESVLQVPTARRAPNPEVVLRSADQLAIVDLARVSDGVGIPRAWLVRPALSRAPQPQYLIDQRYFQDTTSRTLSRWIDVNAELISFNRYSGNVIRRTSQ